MNNKMDKWKLKCPNGHSAVVEIVSNEDAQNKSMWEHDKIVSDTANLIPTKPFIIGGCCKKDCEYRTIKNVVLGTVQIADDTEWEYWNEQD